MKTMEQLEIDTMPEMEWIMRSKEDPAKFKPLYEHYYEPMFRFIYHRMDSKQVTADLTAQVFLKALSCIRKFELRGIPFSAWLYRIAMNEVIDYYKKSNKMRVVQLEDSKVMDLAEEIIVDKKEENQAIINRLVANMQGEDLLLIEMRFFESRSFKEIGDILSITENNAKVKLYRLLDKLKKQAADITSKNRKL